MNCLKVFLKMLSVVVIVVIVSMLYVVIMDWGFVVFGIIFLILLLVL